MAARGISSIISELKYQIEQRWEFWFELREDPLVNPKWLERNEDEENAIRKCVDILQIHYTKWKPQGPIKKIIKESKVPDKKIK